MFWRLILQRGCVWLIVLSGLLSAAEPSAASITALTVAAGPWQQLDRRGLTTVTVRLIPSVDVVGVKATRVRIGTVSLPVAPEVRIVPASAGPLAGQVVASWTLPMLTSGQLTLGSDPRAPTLTIPVPPAPDDPVRILIAGGQAWPTASQVQEFSTALGGPPSLVLVLGRLPVTRIGTGGWESTIPLVLRLGEAETDPLLPAIVGELPPAEADLAWGLLGLPSLRRGPEVAVDCAARPRPWNVLIDPDALWDLGLRATARRSDVQVLRTPVGIARLLKIPLILAGGSAAGMISEPLTTVDSGILRAAAGGVRYVAGTPAGDGVRSLPEFAALAIEEAQLVGLVADPTTLRLVIGTQLEVAWRNETEPSGVGWGVGHGEQLAEAYRAGLKATPPAAIAPELIWLPRAQLAAGEWNILELFALAKPETGAPSLMAQRLARRLVADPQFVGDEISLLRKLPEWLQRDAILRWIAVADPNVTAWIKLAAQSRDPLVISALLAQVEQDHSLTVLGVLVERLAAQAAGTLPVDDDPIMQSRLASAVFDAPQLSPTPLRPIARGLLNKFSPLGSKPVARFLERVGLYREAE